DRAVTCKLAAASEFVTLPGPTRSKNMATLSSFRHFTRRRNIQRILFCAVFILSIASLAYGQSKIEITDPILKPGDKWPNPLDLSFTTSADIKKVRILITAPGNNSKDEFNVDV